MRENNKSPNGLVFGLLAFGLILVISLTITKPVEIAHANKFMENTCVDDYWKNKKSGSQLSNSEIRGNCKKIILKAYGGDKTSIEIRRIV